MSVKKETIEKLTTHYINDFGGLSSRTYDTGNPHLYTAYGLLLLKSHQELDKYPFKVQESILDLIASTKVQPGLYSRQPLDYPRYKGVSVISHDETTGLAYYLYEMVPGLADSFRDYGRENNWTYMEQYPYVTHKKSFKNILRTIKYLFKLASGRVNKEQIDNQFPPETFAFRYKRQWDDRATIERSNPNNPKPKFHWDLMSAIQILVSGIKLDIEYANGTSMLLTWLRGEINERAYKKGNHSRMVRWAYKWFKKRATKTYGPEWLRMLMALHFGNKHPFTDLSEGYFGRVK